MQAAGGKFIAVERGLYADRAPEPEPKQPRFPLQETIRINGTTGQFAVFYFGLPSGK